MSLHDFIDFNDQCPVCGKALTLYMHVSRGALWVAEQPQKGTYQFHQFLNKQEGVGPEDSVNLSVHEGLITIETESPKLQQDLKTWQFFFFKACGIDAFEENKKDYDINLYDICYYRCSPFYEFKRTPEARNAWSLHTVIEDQTEMVNRDESFVFKTMNDAGLEKVYALNLEHDLNHTRLYYYTTTPEQRAMTVFEPNFFEKKDLPPLPHRPDLSIENRHKLLNRLDTWILMS